ncbi:MAG TPA: YafY family protein [Acidimicrobiales bacterium]|nr:YafY family protein [Acidimicrobiales bacterium]
MRADRLVAIVLLLQAHGQLTAGQLAELLETSERTIRRDLDALCVAGVPVYSQRGRGGGWALVGGNRLDLTGFTVDEARALFLVANPEATTVGAAEPSLRSALRKVFTALPEPLRAHAEAAQRTAVIDPAAWGRVRRRAEETPMLQALRDLVPARVQIDIDYQKPNSDPERRRVHPYGLVAKNGVWYLLAGTDRGRRTFRVSRIAAVAGTEEPAVVPDGLDLAGEWESAQRDFFDRLRVVEVVVDVAEDTVLPFTGTMDSWVSLEAHADGAGAPGWRRFSISVPHERAAAWRLAPFGASVRVVSPGSVREELARIGRELLQTNGRQRR